MFVETVWLVPFYGLLGAVLTLPWAVGIVTRTGPRPAAYINLLMTILSVVHSIFVLHAVWGLPPQQSSFTWFQAYDLSLSFSLDLSPVSAGAAVLVGAISLIAQVYAIGYMETDWAIARFFALMGFFEGAMSGIAFSDSLFFSYALLELLTLSTYLLVGFWYAQPLVVTAARDAFWTKRVGDLFLLMGVVALSSLTGSLNFSDLKVWAESQPTIDYFANHPQFAALLGLALIAGPTGKCAQVPLHLWLDEAMEGPNPASILRNSVVVASGAYVLIKLQPLLELSPFASSTLVMIGAITAVGASVVAIAQIDLKRALSHSTSAHLGLVFIAVGMQQTDIALCFLFTHAIAKSLIFMSSGSVMMTVITQDLTEMGGLWSRMPATTIAFLVGSFSLVAIFPLGNFWTMLQWVEAFWDSHPLLVLVLLLVNGITAYGLTRIFGLVFLGPPKPKTRRAPEVLWSVAFPMVSLTILALLVPWLLFSWNLAIDRASVDLPAVALVVGSGIVGCFSAARSYINQYEMGSTVSLPPKLVTQFQRPIANFFANDLYVQDLYRVSAVFVVAKSSKALGWIDRYLVDGAVNFLGLASIFSGESLRYTITGRSQQYIFTILLGTMLVVVAAFLSLR
ncbi:NAD(P)H-quinone oxidoreductase subunit F [Tumidithrix elongata RA019]|uniref:NAD(P)H-quinone oxidoreductase subunit F n=1 Tax=Tumidithrix elongata BACA0141 TaxID=2716417 RepID=A0AAW9Q510_9CYAN|nr:NAD(P)H-quinone oxidoreductase subunit F [Tumidithrix elongata RA019]